VNLELSCWFLLLVTNGRYLTEYKLINFFILNIRLGWPIIDELLAVLWLNSWKIGCANLEKLAFQQSPEMGILNYQKSFFGNQ
jgi:hypothetical protein